MVFQLFKLGRLHRPRLVGAKPLLPRLSNRKTYRPTDSHTDMIGSASGASKINITVLHTKRYNIHSNNR